MFQLISCSFSGYLSLFISHTTKGIATSTPRDKLSSKQHRSKGEDFTGMCTTSDCYQQWGHQRHIPWRKDCRSRLAPFGGPLRLAPLPGSAPGTATAPAPPPPWEPRTFCFSTYVWAYIHIYICKTCPKGNQNILYVK